MGKVLYIVVEGYGEQDFLTQTVAAHLGTKSVEAHVVLVGKPGHKGGVRPWPQVCSQVCSFLKMHRQDRPVYVSLMFDYYRLESQWPGFQQAQAQPGGPAGKAQCIQTALYTCVCQALNNSFNPLQFIPYIQMHELEALIFAEPAKLSVDFPDKVLEIERLSRSVAGMNPETINSGPTTHPAARIINEIPEYEGRKRSAAANVLAAVGLETLRQRCPLFGTWLSALETI